MVTSVSSTHIKQTLATRAEDPAVKSAVSRLLEIRKLSREQAWSKFDLHAAMQELLRVSDTAITTSLMLRPLDINPQTHMSDCYAKDYLNALDLDLENGAEPKEAKPRFVVRSPEPWDRLPLDLKDQVRTMFFLALETVLPNKLIGVHLTVSLTGGLIGTKGRYSRRPQSCNSLCNRFALRR